MKDTVRSLAVVLTLLAIFAVSTVHTSVGLVQWHDDDGEMNGFTPMQLFELQYHTTIVNDDFLQQLWPMKFDMLSFPIDNTYQRIENTVIIITDM